MAISEGEISNYFEDYYNKELIMITDMLGRKSSEIDNKLLFYIYNDGTIERKIKIK